jgi:DNA-binding NtrC family response regulator
MNAAKRQSILIVEPNEQLREQIINYLLSAGYEKTEVADSLEAALNKIRRSAYEVVVASAGEPQTAGLRFAADLAGISPDGRIILMINAEDQRFWDQIAAQSGNIRFLIKTDFARNLLYLLEENLQP